MKFSRIITGLYIGVIGLSCLSISMSLAWYISARDAYVEGIDITIDAEKELKVSTSNELDTFKEKLEAGVDDIMTVDWYKPVSSMYSSLWLNEKKTMPEFRDVSSLIPVSDEGVPQYDVWENGFFRQEFYLLSDDDVYVTLDANKTTILPDLEKNREAARNPEIKVKHPGKSEDEIVEDLNGLVNAMRISILIPDEEDYDYKIVDLNKEKPTTLGGILDLNKDNYYDYYNAQDHKAYEIVYGEINDRSKIIYDTPENNDSILEGDNNSFNAMHRKNIYRANLEESIKNGLEIKEEEALTTDDLIGSFSDLAIPVKRNEPKKIVLSIYLEGWDLDCINDTMGATFNSNITFRILREMI